MSDEESAVKSLIEGLYGPRYCANCKEMVQPIVHVLQGTDFIKVEGTTVRAGFTGSYSCSKCYRNIIEEPNS